MTIFKTIIYLLLVTSVKVNYDLKTLHIKENIIINIANNKNLP